MDLSAGARLDCDIVVIVTLRELRSSLLVRADDAFDASAPVVMMAALQPRRVLRASASRSSCSSIARDP